MSSAPRKRCVWSSGSVVWYAPRSINGVPGLRLPFVRPATPGRASLVPELKGCRATREMAAACCMSSHFHILEHTECCFTWLQVKAAVEVCYTIGKPSRARPRKPPLPIRIKEEQQQNSAKQMENHCFPIVGPLVLPKTMQL